LQYIAGWIALIQSICYNWSEWTGQHKENLSLKVHEFADVSNRAYVAVVYLRVMHYSHNFQVSLICAKTRIAPVKTLSIPRFELNTVVLLNRLLSWTRRSLLLNNVDNIDLWMDSMIVLGWLRQQPGRSIVYRKSRLRFRLRCRTLAGIMFLRRKILPIVPHADYRRRR